MPLNEGSATWGDGSFLERLLDMGDVLLATKKNEPCVLVVGAWDLVFAVASSSHSS